MKSFDTEQYVQIENYSLYARKEDGYINVGKLCSLYGKKFAHWLENSKSQKFLTELESMFKERGITAPLYTKTRKENKHGTYAHPIVAIHVAQWASVKFEVQIMTWIYEMYLTGGVKTQTNTLINHLDDIRMQQVNQENEKLLKKQNKLQQTLLQKQKEKEELHKSLIQKEKEYYNLEVKYEKLKDKKSRHKFQSGNCFYILRDIDCKYEMYKFGQTSNFTNRLSTYRTSSPKMLVKRLIYINKHIEFEDCIKNYFKEKGYLKYSNHEYVEISLTKINEIIDVFLSKFKCDIYEIDAKLLDCINQKYIDCVSTEDVDKIFDYIQETSDTNITHISQKLKDIDTLFEKIHIELEQTKQIACEKQPVQKTIQVKRVTTIDNIIIQDFEHDYPLKRRIRKSDFDYIVEQINLKHIRNTHKWFILQFIFHICYYTGVAPRRLITMTRDDIVNYINGKSIKIGDTYNLLANEFIKSKFTFLLPYIDNLLPGGMVNNYNGKLTYRQLCKWTKTYFDKLEQKNFGKILVKNENYRLYDFKTVLLYRLYNSGMAISDISTFLHHKNICTTQNHLKDHKFLYDESFKLSEEK